MRERDPVFQWDKVGVYRLGLGEGTETRDRNEGYNRGLRIRVSVIKRGVCIHRAISRLGLVEGVSTRVGFRLQDPGTESRDRIQGQNPGIESRDRIQGFSN